MIPKRLLAAAACSILLGIGSASWAEKIEVRGRVFEDANLNASFDAGERPLGGVVVSDGEGVTVTNHEGFYGIRANGGKIVFVSVPGTHHAPGNVFYANVSERSSDRKNVDFPLVANSDVVDDGKFGFAFVSDTHASSARRAPEGIAEAYALVASSNPAFVIHGGDIIMDALKSSDEASARKQYDLYKNRLASLIKVPFYHALGNHDVFGWIGAPDSKRATELYGKKMFETYFGPAYYSFNYEHCHFVVLDSIGRTKTESGAVTCFGYIGPEQIEWLKKDISHVARSRPIVLVTHIPTINALGSCYALQSEVVPTPAGGKSLKHQVMDFPDILGKVFKGYNLKLALAGHYHTYEKIHWKTNEHDALFVVGGSISGEWWKGDRMIGLSSWPEGFTCVSVDGNTFDATYVPSGWRGVEER